MLTALQNSRDAKEFLIARIVEQARRENIPLSEVERKMLYFSETHWTLPDIASVSEKFDHEYNQDEYEAKITHLIKEAAIRDYQQSAEQYALWWDAIRLLKKEDHYILLMVDSAGLQPRRTSQNFKEQPDGLRSISSLVGRYSLIFLTTFVLCFFMAVFCRPEETCGRLV